MGRPAGNTALAWKQAKRKLFSTEKLSVVREKRDTIPGVVGPAGKREGEASRDALWPNTGQAEGAGGRMGLLEKRGTADRGKSLIQA